MERPHERRRLPPLNALRAFEAAARHLNFSRAADELSVTPGAVSQQIQNLEDYVGAALFKRTPKGLLLTDAAQTALPALREAFDRLAEAASLLTAAVDGRRLSLTAPPSFAAKWLVPRLGAFEQAHPQVDVWLSAGIELLDLTAGEVDVAIRYGAGRYPGLEVKRLFSETVIPVAAPSLLAEQPLNAPADLAHHILLHDGSAQRFQEAQFVGIYGDVARGWATVCDDAPYGVPRLACAVERAFLEGHVEQAEPQDRHRVGALVRELDHLVAGAPNPIGVVAGAAVHLVVAAVAA